jgi:hypothetical protein
MAVLSKIVLIGATVSLSRIRLAVVCGWMEGMEVVVIAVI